MMAVVMDGKELAQTIKREIMGKVESSDITPGAASVLVGDEPSSKKYVELKGKDCRSVGINFQTHQLPKDVSEEELLGLIDELNEDSEIHGIIIQLPLPQKLSAEKVIMRVDPAKDVDGLHPYNVGKLWLGDYELERDLVPSTPKGIMELLEHYDVEIQGKEAVIINRSNLVGKPLAKLLLDKNATVTTCHSKTKNIEEHMQRADILVSAVGRRPEFQITENMVKEGAVVVDVGMSYINDKLYGDVDFEEVKGKTSHITPMPGGVGPMTRVALLQNILIAAGI
ncbi:5,10-methylene-tetrahydrofolate cyclohydrolase [candidate division MSBL1 archaeon SCGC-AAA261O19]|uniref:Bifunctional protein FolD n=1 Tax=candidate division MSBL1 archaeon SCGC-AAA261O19 TaxID=1698277 RepID=A0A133VFC2_9EURY|nr:5,10-methylene-tetrahydrofolate cyclohydrolase [candidate division MSBL1 archaeon SCGC-AAA261O19]